MTSQQAPPSPPVSSGLKAWYDASYSPSITKDEMDFVSLWEDLSDEGNDLTQETGSAQPKWIDEVVNSLPVIRFAAGDTLVKTALENNLSQIIWIFMVGTFPSSAGNSRPVVNMTGLSIICNWNLAGDAAINAGFYVDLTFTRTIIQRSAKLNGISSLYREAGIQTTTGDAGMGGASSLTLGGTFSDFDLCELLVYESDLSNEDRNTIESYLMDKWTP